MTMLGHLGESVEDHLVFGSFVGDLPAWAVAVDTDGAWTFCGVRIPAGELVYRPHHYSSLCPACLGAYAGARGRLELPRLAIADPRIPAAA